MSSKKKQDVRKAPVPRPEVEQKPTNDFVDNLGNKVVYVALGLLAIMAFVVFKDYLTGSKAYSFKDIGSDTYNYIYPYAWHVADYIANNGVPKWSFQHGMGQSIFPFFLLDPFFIFLMLIGKGSILYGIVYTEYIKIVGGGLLFYFYLKTRGIASFPALMGCLLFAFCGFAILGSGWNIFSFETFNIALMLLAFELFYKKKLWYLFPIPIFLFSVSQPFNLYVYGLFLAAYALLRLKEDGKLSVKSYGVLLLQLAGLGLIGVLVSGPFLLENIVQLLESPRGSGNTSYANILSSLPAFRTTEISELGTSVMRFFSSDMMGTGNNFKGWQNTLEAPAFYCGIPCLLLMPQLFPFLKKGVRLFFIVFMCVWLLPIVYPYFRHAFWLFTGDYYRAYTVIVVLFMLYYSVQALEKIITERQVNLPILIVSVAVLFLLLNYPYFPDDSYINSPIYSFASLMILVYATLLFFIGRKGSPQYLKYIFLFAAVFELTYFSYTTVNDREAVTEADFTGKKGYNDYTVDALQFLKKNDKSFYRIDKSYSSSPAMHFSLNDAMIQGYNGTSLYSRFNQLHYIRYLQLMGISDKNNELESRWANGLATRPILESCNRVKYMLDKGRTNPLWYVLCDSIATFGDVTVLRNRFILPFGYTYEYYIPESVFEKLSNTQKDFTSMQACVVNDADISKIAGMKEFQLKDTIAPSGFNLSVYAESVRRLAKDSLLVENFENNHISGKVSVDQPKILYMSLPIDGGWTLKVDGKEREKEILFAGMTGVVLSKGQHSIDLVYELRYFNTGLLLTVVGLLLIGGLWFLQRNGKLKSKSDPQV